MRLGFALGLVAAIAFTALGLRQARQRNGRPPL
jgi:hypothetical protein